MKDLAATVHGQKIFLLACTDALSTFVISAHKDQETSRDIFQLRPSVPDP
jgi:hypothetical protein